MANISPMKSGLLFKKRWQKNTDDQIAVRIRMMSRKHTNTHKNDTHISAVLKDLKIRSSSALVKESLSFSTAAQSILGVFTHIERERDASQRHYVKYKYTSKLL